MLEGESKWNNQLHIIEILTAIYKKNIGNICEKLGKFSNFWFREMKSDLERLIVGRDKKTGNWILKKSQDKK